MLAVVRELSGLFPEGSPRADQEMPNSTKQIFFDQTNINTLDCMSHFMQTNRWEMEESQKKNVCIKWTEAGQKGRLDQNISMSLYILI